MELTKEIKEILEDIVWWETCPTDYKFKINAYLKSVNESEALSIHDVSSSFTAEQVVKILKDRSHLEDALSYFSFEMLGNES